MRLLTVSFLLATLVLASCRRSEGVANITSTAPAANPVPENRAEPHKPCVNLNSATAQELIALPGVGEVTARKIIEYREQNGPFRRPQEIIIIEGFSERKYCAIADLVCVN